MPYSHPLSARVNCRLRVGGLPALLSWISDHQATTHKDILHSAMAVVSKLCTKCEPTDDALPECVVALSGLLNHPDLQVSEGALRCFASLSDRFTRKNIDPEPLGRHGLVENLLEILTVSPYTPSKSHAAAAGGGSASAASRTTPSEATIIVIISLLSALCRGSDTITRRLLEDGCNLPDALSAALSASERCVLDAMRFIDLLLLLMFNGRDALPRSSQPGIAPATPAQALDSANHKQLIDKIRSKDSNGLIELIETGSFDVNFMDDVGQTLLNWASAFGTLTMVEYLIKKGADVNRGQRSSSLHYSAVFGRPAIAKVLLRSGANPELRDDDGKTPLDKAREKNEEGHREVVHILQNPGEWMLESEPATGSSSSESDQQRAETESSTSANNSANLTVTSEQASVMVPVVKGVEEEIIVMYLRYWIPQFTDIFQNSLYTSVSKSALTLLRKIVKYMTPNLLSVLCENPDSPYSAQLVETLASVLEAGSDENKVLSLHMASNTLITMVTMVTMVTPW
eukprot:sb/3463913/